MALLRELALAMQTHPKGMQTQVSQRSAAEQLPKEFTDGDADQKAIERAEEFLSAEEMDSGIVVARGNDVAFWHRTLQAELRRGSIGPPAVADHDPSSVWRTAILA